METQYVTRSFITVKQSQYTVNSLQLSASDLL